jgi:CelD/BcsL family acetyltransferase involved in cellulose biosynthesis
MDLTLLRELPADPDFRERWNGLVNSMECPQVFYTWEWARAVLTANRDLQLLLFAAYREGSLVGIAALTSSRTDEKVSLLTSTTADYCDFVSAPQDRAQLVRLVTDALCRMGVTDFQFANIPADSASIPAFASAARDSKLFTFSRPAYLCAQLRLQSSDARVKAVKSARPKAKRKGKALRSSGQTDIVHGQKWGEFALCFARYSEAHVGRFLAEGKISNLIHKGRRDFLEELGRLLDERGWLALSTVTLNGEPIAWNYGMRFHGTWFWYQPAFDAKFSSFSPGTYLLNEIILEASRDSLCHTLELGLGDEGYKSNYAKSGRETRNISASRSIYEIGRQICRYHLAALLKKSSRLEAETRKHVSRIRSLRARKANLAHCVLGRLRQFFFGDSEVVFFEAVRAGRSRDASTETVSQVRLQSLSLESLAVAAMKYETDKETLAYLLRCAQRLHLGNAKGFVLTDPEGIPLHLCWVAPFQGFWISELGRKLEQPVPDSVLIFDCWTPVALRGQGSYSRSLVLVAEAVLDSGKRPWIFSAMANVSSIRGIERSGFVARFSIRHKKKFAFLQNWQEEKNSGEVRLHTAA